MSSVRSKTFIFIIIAITLAVSFIVYREVKRQGEIRTGEQEFGKQTEIEQAFQGGRLVGELAMQQYLFRLAKENGNLILKEVINIKPDGTFETGEEIQLILVDGLK